MSGVDPGTDMRRELREALRALENALAEVRRAHRGGAPFDVEAVREALDLAEAEVKAARERVRKVGTRVRTDGAASDGA